MKKSLKILISVILAVLITAFCAVASSAYEYEGDKYLPDLIIDIANGSDNALTTINDFDRYQRAYEEANFVYGADYKVEFQAGGSDHTHQYICATALRVLANDKGNCLYFTDSNSSIIVENADWPDTYDRGMLFNTHFYNPYTEKNYSGGSETAKVKAADYYSKAVQYYKNGDLTSALQNLSRGSHFAADACEAHHANNKIAGFSNHSAYEKYIDTVRTDFVFPGNTLDESIYEEALLCSVGQIVRNNSYASYCLDKQVTGSSSNPDYYDAARSTVLNAVIANVQYYYKFAVEVGLYD